MADPKELLRRLDQFEAQRTQSAPKPADMLARLDEFEAKRPQAQLVATTEDGQGKFYRDGQGSVSFSSPGYSTSDPAKVQELMQGAKPVDIVQRDRDEDMIAANPIAARGVKAVEGVPFVGSYADEAVGLVSPQARDNMRETSAAMDRQRPGQSFAAGLAGTVASAVPMAMAAAPSVIARAGATLGGRAMQGLGLGILGGGTEGAIYGAGEGDDGDRTKSAVEGGAVGAAFGGVFGAAAPYVSQLVRGGLSRLKNKDVSVIAATLGISKPAATVVRNALEVDDLDTAMEALTRAGDDAMLADAGEAGAVLLDAAVSTGGSARATAKRAVEDRATGANRNMQAALNDTLGEPVGVETAQDAVRTGTKAQRKRLYDAAYAQPIDYSRGRGRAIERLLQRVPGSAIAKANRMMRAAGEQSQQIMADVADDGSVTFTRMPDVRQIDYITRALGDTARETDGKGVMGGKSQEGATYDALQGNIRRLLRREVPEYGTALDKAADTITRINASDFGFKLLTRNVRREQAARELRGMGSDAKDAVKQGVRDYIDEAVANVKAIASDTNDEARQARVAALGEISSPAGQQKLKMLLGSSEADKLIAEVEKARAALELRANVSTRSPTDLRRSVKQSVDEQTAPGALRTLARGEPVNAVQRVVQALTGETDEARDLRRMGVWDEIADALTGIRGPKARQALKLAQKGIEGQKLSEQQAALIGNVLATSGALTASHAMTQQLTR